MVVPKGDVEWVIGRVCRVSPQVRRPARGWLEVWVVGRDQPTLFVFSRSDSDVAPYLEGAESGTRLAVGYERVRGASRVAGYVVDVELLDVAA